MLPCLECAAFRTWVMPSLCNVFLFCATALWSTQQHRDNKEKGCETVSHTGSPCEHAAELMKVSLQHTLQTQDTHTFPMYRLGQTSSTGVSSSVQESKMSCSSLTSTRSCCFLLPDILPAVSSNRPGHCSWCLHPPSESEQLAEGREQVAVRLAPKLALCVQWALSPTGCGVI